ncbi:MOT12-like protein [Mya arenaria]|uniref:MOT12-like protein n=1 Tax=Mya arenaria TaxID=6604 RepID=A0ABY7G667_MYAAR|nr:MOT12-like protein [Mya arenaria]
MKLNNETTPRYGDSKLHADDAISGTAKVPKVPDGGWGWVVCAASFLVHMLIDGSTALIGSLCQGVLTLIGPVVSILVRKFGCRTVVISGALVASASQVVSISAPNMQFLFFSLGVMTGWSFAVNSTKFRIRTNSSSIDRIGVSGTGIETFIFSPETSFLVQKYAWQGAILLHAGLLLNCIVCGLVFLPHTLLEPEHEQKNNSFEFETGTANTGCSSREHLERVQFCSTGFADSTEEPTEEKICDNPLKKSTDVRIACPEMRSLSEQNITHDISTNDNIYTITQTSSELMQNLKGKYTFTCSNFISGDITSLREHFDCAIFKLMSFNLFMVSSFFLRSRILCSLHIPSRHCN